MSIRLVGYQPQYFPRLHYFARILNCDLYTISDYLQYVRKHAYPNPDGTMHRGPSYQAHTPIKNAQGLLLLDVPVKHSKKDGLQLMTEAEIQYESDWVAQHLKNLEHHYKKAPNFPRLYPSLEKVLSDRYKSLADLTIASTLWGLAQLYGSEGPFTCEAINAVLPGQGFRLKKVIRISETGIPPPDKAKGYDANQWIIDKCGKLGADEYYYGGTAAAAYFSFERLAAAHISVIQQDWTAAEYSQQFPKAGFLRNLSIIDLLMNVSLEDARRILSTPNQ